MELNSVLTLTITAVVVTYGMYLTITSVSKSYFEAQKWNLKGKSADTILPLRLQAYERMCLFLERITPDHLIMRNIGLVATSLELQQLLLQEIRDEFNHNLAQQIYISPEAWEVVKNAVGAVQSLVNQSSAGVEPQSPANDLGKRIFENIIKQNAAPTAKALAALKSEVQTLF